MKKNLKSMYFDKVSVKRIYDLCIARNIKVDEYMVAVPENEKDEKIFNKVNKGTFKAFISQVRIGWKHRNYFRRISVCVKNGAVQRLIDSSQVKSEVVDYLREKYALNDVEVLRHILKWLFLEHEEEVNIKTGIVIERVSSQSYDDLDEIKFDIFDQDCCNYLAELFDVSIYEFYQW